VEVLELANGVPLLEGGQKVRKSKTGTLGFAPVFLWEVFYPLQIYSTLFDYIFF
jgi:hypothetical protein